MTKTIQMGALMLAVITATSLTTPAQACGWGSGCAQRTTEGVFREYGPRVPDSIRRGADSVRRGGDALRRGASRYADEFRHAYPRPSIRNGRVTVPNPWSGLTRPRCAGEDC